MLDFLKSAGRDQHLALLMVEFAFHLMQLLDNINKDSNQTGLDGNQTGLDGYSCQH